MIVLVFAATVVSTEEATAGFLTGSTVVALGTIVIATSKAFAACTFAKAMTRGKTVASGFAITTMVTVVAIAAREFVEAVVVIAIAVATEATLTASVEGTAVAGLAEATAIIVIVEAATEVIAMLLEASFLSHLTALVIGLHCTAGSTMVVEFPVEQHVLAQLTLEGAVVERCLERRLEADLLKTLFTVAEDPRLATGVLALELLPDGLVEAEQVGRRDALAIGRISDDESGCSGCRIGGFILIFTLDGSHEICQ